ncbi:MAG: hypothetical protein JWP02_2686 [Acidimicrobiales bacterium]|nr:hypothetical protein [Acidimicrobiales bacterium]
MALVVVLAVPFAVMGPKFILDDWFTLYWRRFDGILWTGGHGQLRARPGAWFTFLVEYGLIGPHPLAVYALQTALNAAIAVSLFVAARAFLPSMRAAAVSVGWVVLQNHSSLDHWAATMPSQVSLLLLLLGVATLVRSTDRGGWGPVAVALFVASALTYEASLPLAAVALVAVPLLRRRPVRWPLVGAQFVPLAAAATWMLAHTQHHEHGWFEFGLVYPAHFGWGITPGRPLGQLLGVAVAIVLVLLLAGRFLPSFGRPPRDATALVVTGLAVVVLGTLAFARDPIEPVALGDRANVMSSIGASLVWVGIGLLLWHWRRRLAVVVGAAFVVMSLTARVWRDVDYARAGRDSDRILATIAARYPDPPAGVIVVGPTPLYHHGVVGLIGEIKEATQAYTGRRGYRALVALHPSDYDAAPVELRVDSRRSATTPSPAQTMRKGSAIARQ